MKNFFKLLSSILLFFMTIYSVGALNSGSGVITNTESSSNSGTVINSSIEDITYTYYYGQGCGYCANVDKYMKSVDGYDKVNINKKEIYYNDSNREDMLSDAQKLGLDPSSVGVPFLIIEDGDNKKPLIGDKPVIDYFENILGPAPENNNGAIILAILAVLAVLLPVFLIKLSNKN